MASAGQNLCKAMQVNSFAMRGDLQGLLCVSEQLQYSKKHTTQAQAR
jgi:hypothetical protein